MIKPLELSQVESLSPIAANLVGQAAVRQPDPKRQRLMWFLHWVSHQAGGLQRFVCDLANDNLNSRLGSPTMHAGGITPSKVYGGEAFEQICAELDYYPLGHATELAWRREALETNTEPDPIISMSPHYWRDADLAKVICFLNPKNRRCSAPAFLAACLERARYLPVKLHSLCTDPRAKWEVPFLSDLSGAIEEQLKKQIIESEKVAACTSISDRVHSTLNHAYRRKRLVVIHGTEGIGKSRAAERWVAANPDKARLISLTASTTDLLFYGEVFKGIGCGEPGDRSIGELRKAIRETVANHDLMPVFDEAHFLFGVSQTPSGKRLEYIRTEFENKEIPAALIVTPQFANRLLELERDTGSNVNQARRRFARWTDLPPKPTTEDVERVARFLLPSVDEKCLRLLTLFARTSDYPLSTVGHVVAEAQTLAEENGGVYTPNLINRAINSSPRHSKALTRRSRFSQQSQNAGCRPRLLADDCSQLSQPPPGGIQADWMQEGTQLEAPAAGRLQSPCDRPAAPVELPSRIGRRAGINPLPTAIAADS